MIYVSDLMTSRVFTLRRTDTLQDVRSLMQLAKIRHIPVTEDGDRFVGLLTHRDLLGYAVSHLAEINREEQEEIESSILVGDIMQTDVRTVAPDTLLREAAEILYRNKYGCLPVLDGDSFPASGHRAAARRLIFHYIKPLEPPSSPSAL